MSGRAQSGDGSELLAARLEVERLRGAIRDIADALRTVYKGSDSGLPALALRRRALALLAAQPPDLGPLRELVRACVELGRQGPTIECLDLVMVARNGLLAAYPSLTGEG